MKNTETQEILAQGTVPTNLASGGWLPCFTLKTGDKFICPQVGGYARHPVWALDGSEITEFYVSMPTVRAEAEQTGMWKDAPHAPQVTSLPPWTPRRTFLTVGGRGAVSQ